MAISLKAPSPFLNRFVTRQPVYSPVNFLRQSHPSIDDSSFSRRRMAFRARTIVKSVLETEKSTKIEKPEPPVKLIALIGKGEVSPLKSSSWQEVMLHTVSNLSSLSLTIIANSSTFRFRYLII